MYNEYEMKAVFRRQEMVMRTAASSSKENNHPNEDSSLVVWSRYYPLLPVTTRHHCPGAPSSLATAQSSLHCMLFLISHHQHRIDVPFTAHHWIDVR